MSTRFQILSLSGGGIKGIFSASVLAALESDFNTSIPDHFDLIVGTSTGGIIALGLGAGHSPRKILEFYLDLGPKIFNHPYRFNPGRILRNKYPAKKLEMALKDIFGQRTLGDSSKRLVIPSYNVGENDVYIFKTRHHPRLRRDYKEEMWKIGMATSAAPTYFPIHTDVGSTRLIDGGIWANNPVMIGVVEAVSMLDIDLSDLRVMSLGTSFETVSGSRSLDNGGLLQWRYILPHFILPAQDIAANNQVEHLIGSNNFVKLNPDVPEGLYSMDKLSIDELLGMGNYESRIITKSFEEVFFDHRSKKFVPNPP